MTDPHTTGTDNNTDDDKQSTAQIKILCSVDLEDLTKTNHAEWHAALLDACIISDADWVVQGSTPSTYIEARHQRKMIAAVRGLIRKSVPEAIRVELPVGCLSQTPDKILSDIATTFLDSSEAVHRRLEVEATSIQLKPGQRISEYLTKHKEIRRRMHQASFPNIQDEVTSVRFAVNGLTGHPRYQEAARAIRLTGIPASLRTLEDRLLEDESATKATSPMFHLQGQNDTSNRTAGGHHNNGNGRGRYRGRGRGTSLRTQLRREISENLRTEFKDEFKKAKPARPGRAQSAQQAGHGDKGMFLLDSAAKPTILTRAPPGSQPLTTKANISTANGIVQVTKSHPVTVKTKSGMDIKSDAYVINGLSDNLLSLTEVVKQKGPVLLTKTGAHVLHPKLIDILKIPPPFATCTKGMYTTKGTTIPRNTVPGVSTPKSDTIPYRALSARTSTNTPPAQSGKQRAPTTTPPPTPSKPRTVNRSSMLLPDTPPPPAFSPHYNTYDPTPDVTVDTAKLHHWHLIFNHAHSASIRRSLRMHAHEDAGRIKATQLSCAGCHVGKMQRAPHKRVQHDLPTGAVMCTDVAGPIHPPGQNGERYIITFTDVGSRFTFVIPIKTRAHVPQAVMAALTYAKNANGQVPSLIHSDNAKEYLSNATQEAARSMGTNTRTTIPYNPEENGIAERVNRTIMDGARTVLATAKMPDEYWPYAVSDVAFKHAFLVHASTDKIPFNIWTKTTRPLPPLFVFGQMGRIPKLPHGGKLEPRGITARYLGINDRKHVLVQTQDGNCRKIRAVDFHPSHKKADPTHNTTCAFQSFKQKLGIIPATVSPGTSPPVNVTHARKYPDHQEWALAYDGALRKLQDEKVIDWTTPAPNGVKTIPLTMAFQYKWGSDGKLTKRKARCSLRGDLMRPGEHYDPDHVQCPTADKSTARLLFAIAAGHGWAIEHLDITNAYVHEPSSSPRPIFVRELPNWQGQYQYGNATGLLMRNLWGGRSAGHNYIHALFAHLRKHKFIPSDMDTCLFTKQDKVGTTAVAVTVDDFLVIADQPVLIDAFHDILALKYTVKRMGMPTEFLGWTVTRRTDGAIKLSQPSLVQTTIENANMAAANGRCTPYGTTEELHPPVASDQKMPDTIDKYRQLVGDLRYLADCTRPDLTYITGKLGAAAHSPTHRHWVALKAVIRYLRQTQQTGLCYPAGQKRRPSLKLVQCYTDSNFAGDASDRKSTSGAVLTYNGTAFAWASRKQSLVALSTAEAEYVALASALGMITTVKRMVTAAGIMPQAMVTVKTDNTATCDMIAKPHGTKRRKFIDLRHHYIQQTLQRQQVQVTHVPAAGQKADMFTKALPRVQFQRQCTLIGLVHNRPYGGV